MPRTRGALDPTGVGSDFPRGFLRKGDFPQRGRVLDRRVRGKPFRLKDTKGLGYLAHLLRHPGTEFHVLDLVGGIAGEREETKPVIRLMACRAEMRISQRPESISRAWAMPARCSTSRPRPPIGVGFRSCAKNWKKPGDRERPTRRAGGSGDRCADQGTVARRRAGWTQS